MRLIGGVNSLNFIVIIMIVLKCSGWMLSCSVIGVSSGLKMISVGVFLSMVLNMIISSVVSSRNIVVLY